MTGAYCLRRPTSTCAASPFGVGRRAFTSFEALLAATILAIVTVAVSSALSAGRAQSATARDTVNAVMLARSLMDEILRQPYASAASTNTTRANFTTVLDYNGYSDGVGTTTPTMTDIAGQSYPTAQQSFTRNVTAVCLPTVQPTGFNTAVNCDVITVTVGKNGQTFATLQRYVTP